MKKALFLFSFLALLSGDLMGQPYPQPQILADIYPQNLFDANYQNQLFRNKFVQVESGSDTVVYFVDQYARRVLMVMGAPTDSGGVVNVLSPIAGDGGSVNPVRFIDGTTAGQYLSWNGTAWVLTTAPINIYSSNGTLAANRTVAGGGFSLTFNGLTTHSETGSGNNTTTTTGTGDIVENSADDVSVTATNDISIESSDAGIDLITGASTTVTSNGGPPLIINGGPSGEQAVYADDVCDLTDPLGVPNIGCMLSAIGDSLPPGLSTQTLRYDALNQLTANYEIRNNGTAVAIGTTTQAIPTRYEAYILGATRINQKLDLGNAISRYQPRATLASNDSTAATPSIWAISNRFNGIHADSRMVIHSRDGAAHSLIAFMNDEVGESSYKIGYGDGFSSLRFCANADSAITNGLAMSIGTVRNIGIWRDNVTEAQMGFAAQTADVSTPVPINLISGPAPSVTAADGSIYYNNSPAIDDLNFVAGSDVYVLAKDFPPVSASLNFPATAPQATNVLTITVTGADEGDQVALGYEAAVFTPGLIFQAYVVAINTVRVVCTNASGGGIDPDPGIFTVRVFH